MPKVVDSRYDTSTFATMNIAICWQYPTNDSLTAKDIFIVQTFSGLSGQVKGLDFFLLTDPKRPPHDWLKSKIQMIETNSGFGNQRIKKFINSIRLYKVKKEKNIGLIISIDDNYIYKHGISSLAFITSLSGIRISDIIRAKRIVVTGQQIKKALINSNENFSNKIAVIPPFPSNKTEIDPVEIDSIKKKFSDGKEYFLFLGKLTDTQRFINLLRALSLFKKRTQSQFKFLFLSNLKPEMQKELSSFRYRDDIKIIPSQDVDEYFHLIASSYAIVLPFNLPGDFFIALNAMHLSVPVIATRNSEIDIMTGENTIIAEGEAVSQISEKMMLIYTNENYRTELINKGTTFVKDFNIAKTVNQLKKILSETLQ